MVVGFTAYVAVPGPPDQLYPPVAPLTVNVVVDPEQIVFVPATATVGVAFTTIVVVAEFTLTQLPLIPDNVYVVVTVGVNTKLVVVVTVPAADVKL